MRRIALVCDWYHPRRGGIEAHLDGLATRLTARGDVVHVITSTPGPTWVHGVRVHRLDAVRLPVAQVAIQPVARVIADLIARERIDVVHSHVSIISPVALAGALAAHRMSRPSVITFHSFVPATPILAGIAGHLVGASHWAAEMTAVSARVVREVHAFSPASRFSLLPNAIDTEFWKPADQETPRPEVTLVFAGRLQSKKRPRLLLEVLERLRQSNVAFRLHIVGTGPLARALERGVEALGVRDRVTFTGWVKSERLRDILRESDVFLSTAKRESFGLAALEARAVGVPVVAMRDSAVADFITDDESGRLADSDASFVRAVARLVTDKPLRQRIREFNRRTPIAYDWNNTLALHDAAYGRATDRIRSRPPL